jgi:hypothetical protein
MIRFTKTRFCAMFRVVFVILLVLIKCSAMRSLRSLHMCRATIVATNHGPAGIQRLHSIRASNGHQFKLNLHILGLAAGMATAAYMSTQLKAAGCEAEMKSDVVDAYAHTALFPPIKPYEKGMLRVSNIHSIAYSVYGNPSGKAVLFVHGGPGGGTDPVMARYFDPKAYRIILVDQRGAGESTPFADLRENTTYDSVRDFEKLREHLRVNKWQVFGGSWGSTLALAYAVSFISILGQNVS